MYKVLKGFNYAHDGINTALLAVGDTLSIHEYLVPGLVEAGMIVAVDGSEAPASDPAPKPAERGQADERSTDAPSDAAATGAAPEAAPQAPAAAPAAPAGHQVPGN
jgi:hypothetical protein